MSPYTKAAVLLIRLVAFGFVLFSLIFLGSEIFFLKTHRKSASVLSIVLKAIPFLAGVALWIKSYAIAKNLTKDLDD
jgi:hypothetical protein